MILASFSWFFWSILATLTIGIKIALFKAPSKFGFDKNAFSVLGDLLASTIAFIIFYSHFGLNPKIMLLAFGWAIFFTATNQSLMLLFKNFNTHSVSPFTSLASAVGTLAVGALFFHDHLAPHQYVAIFSAFCISYFYINNKEVSALKSLFVSGSIMAIVFSISHKVFQKLGSSTFDIYQYILWQLFFTFVVGVLFFLFSHKKFTLKPFLDKKVMLYGLMNGTLQFIATMSIIIALSKGTFSIVYTIHIFYVFVTALVAWKLYKEPLTKQKVILMLFAICTIVLLKI